MAGSKASSVEIRWEVIERARDRLGKAIGDGSPSALYKGASVAYNQLSRELERAAKAKEANAH